MTVSSNDDGAGFDCVEEDDAMFKSFAPVFWWKSAPRIFAAPCDFVGLLSICCLGPSLRDCRLSSLYPLILYA